MHVLHEHYSELRSLGMRDIRLVPYLCGNSDTAEELVLHGLSQLHVCLDVAVTKIPTDSEVDKRTCTRGYEKHCKIYINHTRTQRTN